MVRKLHSLVTTGLLMVLVGCATQSKPGSETSAPVVKPSLSGKEEKGLEPTEKAMEKPLSPVDTLLLLPQPRRMLAASGVVSKEQAPSVQVDENAMPHPQGYILDFSADKGIIITAHDAAGAFYAHQTIAQIFRQYPENSVVPALRIEDWPDFPHRGVMLDIARDKVPTMETLYALADRFASMKYNQIQLYTEHTFAYRGHEVVWKEASPMTGEEIRALDAYCKERFIELVPNQNSFGHMGRWLSHPEYASLAEKPGAADLCPVDPQCVTFLKGLYADLLPNFSSSRFNVGCDETYSLGKGRSKAEADRIGKGRVYLGFLKQIEELVAAHGKTMEFWGDIIMQYPELIPEIPPNVIAMEWGYEANHPFAEHGKKFADSGIPFDVVPGTSSWNSLLGRTDNALENLRNAAQNGFANGAEGFLVTDWGDGGHWQFIPVSYAPFAYGAAVSWCYEKNVNLPLAQALDIHVFEDKAGRMGQAALDLGNAHLQTGVSIGNSTVYYALLKNHKGAKPSRSAFKAMTAASADAAMAALDAGLAMADQSQMHCPDGAWILEEYRTNVALARFSLELGRACIAQGDVWIAGLDKPTRQHLAEELETIIETHKRLWLQRNRPGGLKDSMAALEALVNKLKAS